MNGKQQRSSTWFPTISSQIMSFMLSHPVIILVILFLFLVIFRFILGNLGPWGQQVVFLRFVVILLGLFRFIEKGIPLRIGADEWTKSLGSCHSL